MAGMDIYFSFENLGFIIWVVIFATVYGLAELMYGIFKVPAVYTRKYLHVVCGFLLIYYPFVMASYGVVALVCGVCCIVLVIARKKKLMPSLFNVDYNTDGSLYYTLNVFVMYIIWSFHTESFVMYRIPMAILTFSDAAAAITGRKWPLGKFSVWTDTWKTRSGSMAFFLVSSVVVFILLSPLSYLYSTLQIVLVTVVIALVTTIVEAFSPKGTDNITVPVSAAMLLWVLKVVYLGSHL